MVDGGILSPGAIQNKYTKLSKIFDFINFGVFHNIREYIKVHKHITVSPCSQIWLKLSKIAFLKVLLHFWKFSFVCKINTNGNFAY